jgi:hypothetical protein
MQQVDVAIAFPRFHVGESLMPATVLVLEEMGARRVVRLSLRLLLGIARVETWMRRRRGLPVESRLEW